MPTASTASNRALLRARLADAYCATRATTLRLCQPLSSEDMVVQVEPCASPTKWHLAHTTWFFETFVLQEHEEHFAWHDDAFPFLYNSYYHGVGEMLPRAKRGLVTRPSLEDVLGYRNDVDARVMRLINRCDDATLSHIMPTIELGLNHEQQHQELLLTDIKLLLFTNPLGPAYRKSLSLHAPGENVAPLRWVSFSGGVVEIGHEGGAFAYDNEGPRHREFLEPYDISHRLITNSEFMEFVRDGGYDEPRHWLDDGWTRVQREHWKHPQYWRHHDDHGWQEFTLHGWRQLDPSTPACHISFFEADAFARWRGARLPTEAEWEHAAETVDVEGNFLENNRLHPAPLREGGDADADGRLQRDSSDLQQMFGDVWEWTRSAHEPYPGYTPPEGAIGEYNGKFMNGCYVLRGGSCVTGESHIRRTYRNFFEPAARWQFMGIRLARSR